MNTDAMLEMLKHMYGEAPKTEQDIKDGIDELSKKLGMTCKACGKLITGDNCNDHWFFRCNPDYTPEPLQLAIEQKPATKEQE